MRLTVLSLFLALLMATAVSGCGIKPGTVSPPASVEHDTFPKTYPNLATDPQPERRLNP